jgi:dihydroorotate dehydrogenase/NAD-dependent dihydropyrimidine dehydrogenase PreA subunit
VADLRANWGELKLKNPLIVAASSLGNNIEKLKRFEAAGAAAVVTKVISRRSEWPKDIHLVPWRGVVKGDSFLLMGDPRLDLEYGTWLVKEAKKTLRIPVIANFMGLNDDVDVWVSNAKALEAAGADALELDFASGATNTSNGCSELEIPRRASIMRFPAQVKKVVKALTEAVGVPVIPKLHYGGEVVPVANACIAGGTKTITMSNVLGGLAGADIEHGGKPLYPFAPTQRGVPYCGAYINPIHNMTLTALKLGVPGLSIASGGGVMNWRHVVERIMLGADSIQLCSTLYLNGLKVIGETLRALELYLDQNDYKSFADIRGQALRYYDGTTDAVDPCVAQVKSTSTCSRCADPCVEKVSADCLAMSKSESGAPVIDAKKCTGCALCYWACGSDAIEMVRTKAHIDYRII